MTNRLQPVDINMEDSTLKGSNAIRFKVTAPFRTMQVDLYAVTFQSAKAALMNPVKSLRSE